jgi:hypothetical protein
MRSVGYSATNGGNVQVSSPRLISRLERPLGTSGYFWIVP